MEIFRPLIGFVLGVAVMVGAYAGGWLDRIPHARINPDDPYLHARYHIRAAYLPSGDRGDCPPQYEFHNGTNRLVTFSGDGTDDHSYGNSSYGGPTNVSAAQVSMTPSDYGPPSSGGAQPDDSQTYGDQSYGPDRNRGGGYDSRSDSTQDYGPDGGDDVGYSQDDIEYRGDTSGPCTPGVVQIFVDRRK